MKKLSLLLMSLVLTAVLLMPALADELRGHIKVVDADKGIVTLVEGQKDYHFTTTPETKFLNLKGGDLVNGIKSNDLREGRRVIVHYDSKDGQLVLTSLQIRAPK